MPSRENRTELLVGVFVFIGLTLLGGLIVQYGQFFGGGLGEVYRATVEFRDASGIIKGSEVKLAGAKIGQVENEPELTANGNVTVVLLIQKSAPKLPKNSVFQIASLGIIGDRAIVVTLPQEELADLAYIEDGDILKGGGASGLEALKGDAEMIASDVRILTANAKDTLRKIDAALDEVSSVAGRLSESVDQVNSGLLSEENMGNISDSLANLKAVTQNIEIASQSIGPLMEETQTTVLKVGNAAESAEETFANANAQIDNLEPALKELPKVMNSLSETAESFEQVAEKAVEAVDGDGLLGTLANDQEVKEDATSFMKNLRRYGILGYKDESTFDERDPRNRYRGSRR